MAATTMGREQFVDWLRSEFPRLLQEDPRFSAEVVGILSQTLSSRAEFNRLLEEIRRLREDSDRRFEAIERTLVVHGRILEEHSRKLEEHSAILREHSAILREHSDILHEHSAILREHSAILREHSAMLHEHTALLQEQLRELRSLHVTVTGMGDRRGRALEETVRMVIEEFSGVGPLRAERLVLTDTDGEVFGVRGQVIEFDWFVHDGRRFLVEVKSFAKREDVWLFSRKLQFAERHIQEPFERIMVAPYAREGAVELARELGIQMLTLTEPKREP